MGFADVIHTLKDIFLSQHKHIHDVLTQFDTNGANDVMTSLSTVETLSITNSSPTFDATPYHNLVGSLKYLAFTRPDISFAINKLSQFMHAPCQTH